MDAGFENEFVLLKSVSWYMTFCPLSIKLAVTFVVKLKQKIFFREGKEEWVPIDSAPYCSTASFDFVSPILDEIVGALHSLDITVEQVL